MKTIAIVTGTRAEYGLLKPLISVISNALDLSLQLFVTGMHLEPAFGNTWQQIEKDGFEITAKVSNKLNADTSEAITKSIGTGMIGFADVFEKYNPEIVLVLGDRSEILAVVIAAMIKGIPVGHLHGGETTEGAYDEGIRHAITKMSYLHFTSTEIYRKRVIQLGEDPNRVFNVGAIGIDSIKNLKLFDKEEFQKSIDYKLNKKSILITFHPVTLENATARVQFQELLASLDILEDTTLIFTKPNSDKDGKVIIEMIDNYVAKNSKKAVCFTSLGQLRYLSSLQHVDVVVGNSSSGIYEVPIFKKPTINIGDRQKGRLMPASIISCEPLREEISKAIQIALSITFNNEIKKQESSIYGDGRTAIRILKIIKEFNIESVKKSFYDINFN